MTERTFSIIKPDATRRNLTGKVNAVIEDAGLRIVAQRRIQMTEAQAKKFYEVHAERPFYGELVEFMTSAPVVVQVLEGENAVARYREVMGATNPKDAADGTIRKPLRRERRRELGPRLGQPGERRARDRPVLHGRRHRRLIAGFRGTAATRNRFSGLSHGEHAMKTIIKFIPVAGAVALLAACGTTMEQRAATGAIAGAAAGQVIGGDTTSTVAGAVIGGAAGAATRPD